MAIPIQRSEPRVPRTQAFDIHSSKYMPLEVSFYLPNVTLSLNGESQLVLEVPERGSLNRLSLILGLLSSFFLPGDDSAVLAII